MTTEIHRLKTQTLNRVNDGKLSPHQDINKYKRSSLYILVKFIFAISWLVQASHCILNMWHFISYQCKKVKRVKTQLECISIVVGDGTSCRQM